MIMNSGVIRVVPWGRGWWRLLSVGGLGLIILIVWKAPQIQTYTDYKGQSDNAKWKFSCNICIKCSGLLWSLEDYLCIPNGTQTPYRCQFLTASYLIFVPITCVVLCVEVGPLSLISDVPARQRAKTKSLTLLLRIQTKWGRKDDWQKVNGGFNNQRGF